VYKPIRPLSPARFGSKGGGGGGSHVETMTVTTSGSHLDAREVVVVAAWV